MYRNHAKGLDCVLRALRSYNRDFGGVAMVASTRCASVCAAVGKKAKQMWEASCKSIAVFQERGDVDLLDGEGREEEKDSLGTFLRGHQRQSHA